ncbi:hypothetical protein IAR50_001755 [Cryptococcus sp. DSM 104548]
MVSDSLGLHDVKAKLPTASVDLVLAAMPWVAGETQAEPTNLANGDMMVSQSFSVMAGVEAVMVVVAGNPSVARLAVLVVAMASAIMATVLEQAVKLLVKAVRAVGSGGWGNDSAPASAQSSGEDDGGWGGAPEKSDMPNIESLSISGQSHQDV